VLVFALVLVGLCSFYLAHLLTPPGGSKDFAARAPEKYTGVTKAKIYFSESLTPPAEGTVKKTDIDLPFAFPFKLDGYKKNGIWYDIKMNGKPADTGEKMAVFIPVVTGDARIFVDGELFAAGPTLLGMSVVLNSPQSLIQIRSDISGTSFRNPMPAIISPFYGKINDLAALRALHYIQDQVGFASDCILVFAIVVFGMFFLAYPGKPELFAFMIFMSAFLARNLVNSAPLVFISLNRPLILSILDFLFNLSLLMFSLVFFRVARRRIWGILLWIVLPLAALSPLVILNISDVMGAVNVRQPAMTTFCVLYFFLHISIIGPRLLHILAMARVPTIRKITTFTVFATIAVVLALNFLDALVLNQAISTEYRNGLILCMALAFVLALEFSSENSSSETGKLALQVAHDIRSPLAALEMCMIDTQKIPAEQRQLMRNAVSRIRDIASDLIERDACTESAWSAALSLGDKKRHGLHLVAGVLEAIVAEKRAQYRGRSGVLIDGAFSEGFGLFTHFASADLKRIISNVINNSVDALKNKRGKVEVALSRHGSETLIQVKDDGVGIPSHVLQALGKRGLSFGKKSGESGSGVGISDSMAKVKAAGGRVEFESEPGQGTTVKIFLPVVPAPEWFLEELRLKAGTTVVVADDDSSIHEVWQTRLSRFPNLRIVHFSSLPDLESWIAAKQEQTEVLYLLDYEFADADETGLEFAIRKGLQSGCHLVTSRFEERNVQSLCAASGIRIVPKGSASTVPIRVS
jgi:signal transduction histidine kinase